MPPHPSHAWKIEAAGAWRDAETAGVYAGSDLDRRDGFIHLSADHQVRRTAELYFAGQPDLILARIDLERLGGTVLWEASRNGDLFPHIHGPLPMTAVTAAYRFTGPDGGDFAFPDEIP